MSTHETQTKRKGTNMDTIPLGFTISPGTYLRWPCSVCGGETSKTPVLCESDDRGEYDGCPEPSIRVCEDCLRGGEKEIHSTLNAHADQLLARAQYLRSLIGRLEIPTYDEWRAVAERVDEDWCRWAGEETDDEPDWPDWISRDAAARRIAADSGPRLRLVS
jgi:hypothetical protein